MLEKLIVEVVVANANDEGCENGVLFDAEE